MKVTARAVGTSPRPIALLQKVGHQLRKAGGVFDLRPMAALPVDVQLRAWDEVGQPVGVLDRDDLVVPAMDDQGFVGQGGNVFFRAGQRLHPALTRRRKHGGKAFLETGADAGLEAQLRGVVGDEM